MIKQGNHYIGFSFLMFVHVLLLGECQQMLSMECSLSTLFTHFAFLLFKSAYSQLFRNFRWNKDTWKNYSDGNFRTHDAIWEHHVIETIFL